MIMLNRNKLCQHTRSISFLFIWVNPGIQHSENTVFGRFVNTWSTCQKSGSGQAEKTDQLRRSCVRIKVIHPSIGSHDLPHFLKWSGICLLIFNWLWSYRRNSIEEPTTWETCFDPFPGLFSLEIWPENGLDIASPQITFRTYHFKSMCSGIQPISALQLNDFKNGQENTTLHLLKINAWISDKMMAKFQHIEQMKLRTILGSHILPLASYTDTSWDLGI